MKQTNVTTSSSTKIAKQEQAVNKATTTTNNIIMPEQRRNGSTTTAAAASAGSTSAANSNKAPAVVSTIGTKPTLIERGPLRFLIMDAPRQSNLHLYIREMRKHHVVHVVRVCEQTYTGLELKNAGIDLHEMEYKDGTSPSTELIRSWLELVDKTFYSAPAQSSSSSDPPPCIAVHCVAGLGRAPVMVAIALIEFLGMDPVEAVTFLREKRRGAINDKQLTYLGEYKKQYKKRGGASTADGGCCVILWITTTTTRAIGIVVVGVEEDDEATVVVTRLLYGKMQL